MRAHRGRGRWVVVGIAGALALTACRTDRVLTEPDPVPVTEELLAGSLLTVDDLPEGSGFTTVEGEGTPIDAEIVPEHGCDDAIAELDPELSVSRDFTSGDVTLTSTAAWFPGAGGAAEQVLRNAAAECSQAVSTAEGVSIRTGPLDFGVLSDDTIPFRFEVEPETGTIEERDLIIMRKGDLLHVVRLTGPRPSDKVILDAAVRVLIGRLGLLHDDTT